MKMRRIISNEPEQYRVCRIEVWEINAIIKNGRKTSGPDEIPVELF